MGKEQSEKIPINSRGELWGDFAEKSTIQKFKSTVNILEVNNHCYVYVNLPYFIFQDLDET